ncbi:MAG: hypothetical protein ACT4ON_00705 [Bacteroidota bacterium]
MGYKNVCLGCRKAFNRTLNTEKKIFKCPECSKDTTSLSHRFRPPVKNDLSKWAVVKLLIENGFTYDHIYLKIETNNGVKSYSGYAKYPENIRDAREFIEKYKDQVANTDS